jgi:hypothetical protein
MRGGVYPGRHPNNRQARQGVHAGNIFLVYVYGQRAVGKSPRLASYACNGVCLFDEELLTFAVSLIIPDLQPHSAIKITPVSSPGSRVTLSR